MKDFIFAKEDGFEPLRIFRKESFPDDFTREMIVEYIKERFYGKSRIDSVVVGRCGEFYACSKFLEAEFKEVDDA